MILLKLLVEQLFLTNFHTFYINNQLFFEFSLAFKNSWNWKVWISNPIFETDATFLSPTYDKSLSNRHTIVKLAIDPLTLFSIAAFLAAAVYFLNEIVELLMLRRKRRKRNQEDVSQCNAFVLKGKQTLCISYSVGKSK